MKTLAVVLLTFMLCFSLISILFPVPFISFVIALLAFPLALKLSWRELFVIQLIHTGVNLLLKFDWVFFQFQLGFTLLEGYEELGLTALYDFYKVGYWIALAGMAVLFSMLLAGIMKGLSRFTPKRFRAVLEGK